MQEHTEAFEELKNMLSSDTVQAFFDPQGNTSSTWTGVRWDWQPLSRSGSLVKRCGKLCGTPVEASQTQRKRYSQMKLEALLGDFGCKKFHLFLYGIPFKMVTDQKPLESVFNKPTRATLIRVQRMHLLSIQHT